MRELNPRTFATSFECREDMAPEFDAVKPDGFKWGFVLPIDTDFYVFMGRHARSTDLNDGVGMIDVADLVLVEGPQDAQFLLDSAEDADNEKLAKLQQIVPNDDGCADHNRRLLEEINRRKVAAAFSDPPFDHKIWTEGFDIERLFNRSEPQIYFRAERANLRRRDLWFLHNLKAIVDMKLPHKAGERRAVLIIRGASHFPLLRALEYQCEYNPHKSNGSCVVASCVKVIEQGTPLRITEFNVG